MSTRKSHGKGTEKYLSAQEQQAKINDVKKILGPIAEKRPVLCSDASISRFLRARNWSARKAAKMLKEDLKWRFEFKPSKIRWEDIACEPRTGKMYKANCFDKKGRTVLIFKPGLQNSSDVGQQIRYLVYCLENAIFSNPDQEQMLWLIDFQGWTMASISVKAARETAQILQNHYPERLALAIFYNPPKVFESFWMLVKPFIEPKTYRKVRFVYSNVPQSQKTMEELFDMNELGSTFGGRNPAGFDYEAYAQRMREDDKKRFDLINHGRTSPISSIGSESQASGPDSLPSGSESQTSETVTDITSEASDGDDSERTSNVDNIDEVTQGLLLGCQDVADNEAADTAKEQNKGKDGMILELGEC